MSNEEWFFGYLFGMDVAEKNVWEMKKCHPNQIIITQSTLHVSSPFAYIYAEMMWDFGMGLFYFIFSSLWW